MREYVVGPDAKNYRGIPRQDRVVIESCSICHKAVLTGWDNIAMFGSVDQEEKLRIICKRCKKKLEEEFYGGE